MSKSPFALQRPFSLTAADPVGSDQPVLWFVYLNGELVLQAQEETNFCLLHQQHLPLPDEAISYSRAAGFYGESLCVAVELATTWRLSHQLVSMPLRQSYQYLGHDLWTIAGRAAQLLDWHRLHRFCSGCGEPLQELFEETAKKCPQCGQLYFPHLSPAVIMAVVRGDNILLGRSPHFPPGMYSPLAGFVEPGETLEEAVAREVLEEVGITVADIRYQASQPWPFPNSLMVGFSAAYHSGTISIDHNELEDARWFSAATMPEQLPSAMSISRWLVDRFLAGRLAHGLIS